MTNRRITAPPRITSHAKQQAANKGFTLEQVFLAHTDPDICYPSTQSRFPNQQRHVRDGLVVVVDATRNMAVTIYENVVETPLRPDQIAAGVEIGKAS